MGMLADLMTKLGGQAEVPLPPEKRLSYEQMYDHIMRTPELRAKYMAARPQSPQFTDEQVMRMVMGEAAALGDPFGAIGIQRALGGTPNAQIQINEAHGLANKEDRKRNGYWESDRF